MQTRFGIFSHDQTDTIVCPRCGNCGVINWDLVPSPDGPKKEFAGISGEFYERLSKKSPHPIEIVCNNCVIAVPCRANTPHEPAARRVGPS